MTNRHSVVSFIAKNPTLVLLPIMAIGLVYWLWFGIAIRNINTDEARSLIAAESILEHGYQLFPSGYVYNRGYLPHYLIAGSIRLFGFNIIAIILPAMIMALGTSWMTFRIARDIFGRPWLGVVAAAFLLSLQVQTFYATSPRMYMFLQFFTMLGAYSAWRGYIEEDFKFKVVAMLAIGAAMLSHRQGILLTLVIPTAIAISHIVYGKRIASLLSVSNIVSLVYLGLVAYWVMSYEPQNSMPAITVRGGLEPDRVGLNLSILSWAKHIRNLETALPYGLALLPIAGLAVLRDAWDRCGKCDVGFLYALLFFGGAAFGVTFGLKGSVGTRTWLFLLPVYTLLVLFGGYYFVQLLAEKVKGVSRIGRIQTALTALLFAIGLFLSMGVATLVAGPLYEGETLSKFGSISFAQGPDLLGTAKLGYGLPCHSDTCSDSVASRYDTLRKSIGFDDVVISSQPVITHFYLDRVEGYVGERRMGDGTYSEFPFAEDEYMGVPLIDSVDKLKGLLDSQEKMWIIAHPNFQNFSSQEMRNFLANNYTLVFEDESIKAYTNCNQAPCGSN